MTKSANRGCRCGVGGVESKSRDLGNDRGYRVVVVLVWAGLSLNPHPLKAEGAAPNCRNDVVILWTWGAACCALHIRGEAKFEAEMRLVADAAFYGGVAFAGVDDYFLFFAFLVVDD
jgi:hypothetical protein